jgi:hypothetical protein
MKTKTMMLVLFMISNSHAVDQYSELVNKITDEIQSLDYCQMESGSEFEIDVRQKFEEVDLCSFNLKVTRHTSLNDEHLATFTQNHDVSDSDMLEEELFGDKSKVVYESLQTLFKEYCKKSVHSHIDLDDPDLLEKIKELQKIRMTSGGSGGGLWSLGVDGGG